MVGAQFGLEQLLAARLAARIALAYRRFLAVAQPGRHRPGRHEHRRQMTEAQRADQQTRDDLVAHAQVQAAVEDGVGQTDGGGLGDQVAGEQRKLHAGHALGDAVAHRRHPGSELCAGTVPGQGALELLGVVVQRLVRRQHVVVAGDDGDMRRAALAHDQLRIVRLRGERMSQIGAADLPARLASRSLVQTRQVARAALGGTRGDARGHRLDNRVQHGDSSTEGVGTRACRSATEPAP
ncbi:hypothetical protein D3C75_784920 [compost metagenome]